LSQRARERIVEKDFLLKRLLTKAGVSFLAGLVVSSAVPVRNVIADTAEAYDAPIGIDVGDTKESD